MMDRASRFGAGKVKRLISKEIEEIYGRFGYLVLSSC